MKTLMYLFETRIQRSYLDKYGMNYFSKRGFNVMIFDLSEAINKPLSMSIVDEALYNEFEIVRIKKTITLANIIRDIDGKKFAILKIPYYLNTFRIFKILSKFQVKYIFLANDQMVYISFFQKNSLLSYIQKPIYFLNSIFARIPHRLFRINPAYSVVFGGTRNNRIFLKTNPISKSTTVKNIHSTDYNQFLELKNSYSNDRAPSHPNNYILFIDQYMPYHPENIINGININAEKYYKEINNFLTYLKKILNLDVIVAAHPKSEYIEKNLNAYNYKTIKGDSHKLIYESKLVIMHHSTLLHQILVNNKDFILTTTDSIELFRNQRGAIVNISKEIGKEILNISNYDNNTLQKDLSRYISIDNRLKNEYIKKYVKSDLKNKDVNIYEYLHKLMNKRTS